jgi:hypothetical protein
MTQTKDHDRVKAKPYLIAREEESGEYLLILRETRFNSQNYPLVKETPQPERFGTVAAARAFAKAEFGAVAGQFATQAGRAD